LLEPEKKKKCEYYNLFDLILNGIDYTLTNRK